MRKSWPLSSYFFRSKFKYLYALLFIHQMLGYSRADFKKLNEMLLIAPWEDITAASPTPHIALSNITDIINHRVCTCIPFRITESNKSTSVDAKPWINQNLKKMIRKRHTFLINGNRHNVAITVLPIIAFEIKLRDTLRIVRTNITNLFSESLIHYRHLEPTSRKRSRLDWQTSLLKCSFDPW